MKKRLGNMLFLLPLLLLVVVDSISLAQAIITPEMEYRGVIIIVCSLCLLACVWVGAVVVTIKKGK